MERVPIKTKIHFDKTSLTMDRLNLNDIMSVALDKSKKEREYKREYKEEHAKLQTKSDNRITNEITNGITNEINNEINNEITNGNTEPVKTSNVVQTLSDTQNVRIRQLGMIKTV